MAQGPLYIGTGSFGSTTGEWVGTLPWMWVYDRTLSPERRATDARSFLTPTALYGASQPVLASATAPVVCVPVFADTAQGTAVNLDVVTPALGTGVSISAIGTPSNGAAVNAGGGVVTYTPGASFVGVDLFTVTLTDGDGNTSTATMTVNVTSQVIGSGTLPNGQTLLDNDIASPSTVAANTGNLQTQLNAATAGDVIECATGTYAGDYTLSASGTADNPIKITFASSLHDAVFTGKLTITGDYVTVDGLRFQGAGRIETSNAGYHRITRCYWTSVTGFGTAILLNNGFHDVRVDRCRFDGGATGTGIQYGIYCKPAPNSDVERYVHIHDNHFSNWSLSADDFGSPLRLHDTSHSQREHELFALVEYNFFDNYTRKREVIVSKCSQIIVRFNKFTGTIGDIGTRVGSDTTVYGNVMIGVGGVACVGVRNKVYSNYIARGVRGIVFFAGDYRWAGSVDSRQPGFQFPTGDSNLLFAKPSYDAADQCIAANNTIIYDAGIGSLQHNGAIAIGTNFSADDIQFAARNIDVINNLVIREAGSVAPIIEGDAEDIRYAGNVTNVSGGLPSGWTVGNPTFSTDADGIDRPTVAIAGVPVVNYGPLAFTLDADLDGQAPGSTTHVGCDQKFATGTALAPAVAGDVGFNIADRYA